MNSNADWGYQSGKRIHDLFCLLRNIIDVEVVGDMPDGASGIVVDQVDETLGFRGKPLYRKVVVYKNDSDFRAVQPIGDGRVVIGMLLV